MTPGSHGSTFGGNPLAMSIGNAVLDKVLKKNFLKSVQKISKYFLKELKKIKKEYPELIKEVRGVGLLIGIQLHEDQTKFIQNLEKNRLLVIKAAENVIRILPPLNVNKSEIDLSIKIIKKFAKNINKMKHFINLKDIESKDLKKILIDAKKRKYKRKN